MRPRPAATTTAATTVAPSAAVALRTTTGFYTPSLPAPRLSVTAARALYRSACVPQSAHAPVGDTSAAAAGGSIMNR